MKVEIKIPPMGESITDATIGNLLVQSGSQVNADQEILEIETDKVNQALYAPEKGTITFTVQPGQKVNIGDVIGYVETGDADKPVLKPAEAPPPAQAKAKSEKQQAASLQAQPQKEPISPSTGPGSRFGKNEFLNDLAQPQKQKQTEPQGEKFVLESSKKGTDERETRAKLSRVRKVIGDRMVKAQRDAAMLTTFNEADMTQIIALREKFKEDFQKTHGVKLGFMSFFVKAVVAALKEYPLFNSYLDGDELVQRHYFDIGVAVGTDKGLFVPVIRNCDQLSFAEIEKALEKFAKKAREGDLTVDELQGGGFTITNGGVYGSLLSTPILNPPQPGILGMHKIQKRPVVIDDQIAIRSMMYLALSYDHRVADGKDAVNFLVYIKNHLEDPVRLQLEIA